METFTSVSIAVFCFLYVVFYVFFFISTYSLLFIRIPRRF